MGQVHATLPRTPYELNEKTKFAGQGHEKSPPTRTNKAHPTPSMPLLTFTTRTARSMVNHIHGNGPVNGLCFLNQDGCTSPVCVCLCHTPGANPHIPVDGSDFMPDGWCGGCETCGPVQDVCATCSYDDAGNPLTPVSWPCEQASA